MIEAKSQIHNKNNYNNNNIYKNIFGNIKKKLYKLRSQTIIQIISAYKTDL